MTKRCTILAIPIVLGLAAGAARAQNGVEPIPANFLQEFAPLAVQFLQQLFPDPPVRVEANPQKAVGFHIKEQVAIVALPDRNFSARAVEEAGEKETPVALVTTRALTLEEREVPVGAEKLAVADFNGKVKLPVFYLAVTAAGEDRVLRVYSREKQPIGSVTLKKQAGEADPPVALKIAAVDMEKKKLDAVLSLGGAYEGTLKLAFLQL